MQILRGRAVTSPVSDIRAVLSLSRVLPSRGMHSVHQCQMGEESLPLLTSWSECPLAGSTMQIMQTARRAARESSKKLTKEALLSPASRGILRLWLWEPSGRLGLEGWAAMCVCVCVCVASCLKWILLHGSMEEVRPVGRFEMVLLIFDFLKARDSGKVLNQNIWFEFYVFLNFDFVLLGHFCKRKCSYGLIILHI